MATLTSRHADAYINLGEYASSIALLLSWYVHISVSVIYALISTYIFNYNSSLHVSIFQILLLGWVTTLIATPANFWVVKLITTHQFTPLSALPSLNTEIGAKFWLHILFFGFVLALLCLNKKFLADKI